MGAFLPGGVKAVEQRQQQATQMKNQRSITAHLSRGAKMIDLGIKQKVAEVQRQQQKHFALTAIHQTERATEQQQQGGQHIEQRGEELAQHRQARQQQAAEQKQQRRQKMAKAHSSKTRQDGLRTAAKSG